MPAIASAGHAAIISASMPAIASAGHAAIISASMPTIATGGIAAIMSAVIPPIASGPPCIISIPCAASGDKGGMAGKSGGIAASTNG